MNPEMPHQPEMSEQFKSPEASVNIQKLQKQRLGLEQLMAFVSPDIQKNINTSALDRPTV